MIAILATEDPHGYPLWIGKVIKIEKENDDVIAIEVHWYATSTPIQWCVQARNGG
jgi:hypothetical protein